MIELHGLAKRFGPKRVLRGVDLTIHDGETLVIIGRSGTGKSVLLKHIVGLLKPDAGRVVVDGETVGELDQAGLYRLRSRFGFLFQMAALFDSMTVGENVGLALRENSALEESEIDRIVGVRLAQVGLPGIERLRPSELSGGMRKRVGLARALATDPRYMLYDEPTTGLDPIMSDAIDELILQVGRELNVTSLVVTHDMATVDKVASRVVMLHEGCVYFDGTPAELRATTDPHLRGFVERKAGDEIQGEMAALLARA